MKRILRKYLIIILVLYLLHSFIPAFKIQGGLWDFLYAGFILYILNNILKPLLSLIFFPINILTFNFSIWIIHILIFYLWSLLVPYVKITSWNFPGIDLGSIIIFPMQLSYLMTVIILGIVFVLVTKFINWLAFYR